MSIRYILALCMCAVFLIVMLWHIYGFIRCVRRHQLTRARLRKECLWLAVAMAMILAPCILILIDKVHY